MIPDMISKLLGGQGGTNPLMTLLPMLLGGKSLDLSSLLGSVSGNVEGVEKGNSFPPLFGAVPPGATSSSAGIMDLLGRFIPPRSNAPETQQAPPAYPYELQYNRPYMHELHK